MPLTAGGNLKIVASADLGALGAKAGLPLEYNWVLPSVAPVLLPWLAVLGLLTLRPNRNAAAWLVWLPLGCVLGLTLVAPPALPPRTNFFLDVILAMAIGLAAVWLLSTYLRRSHRLLTFLCVLLTLAGFSVLALVARQGWYLLEPESIEVGVFLTVGVLVSSVALTLSGWICRRRFQPIALYVCLPVALASFWILIAAPFFLVALATSRGGIAWSEFFIPILSIAAGNFALLLPFLILSSANPFFRERLKALLHVRPIAPPPLPPTAFNAGI